MFNFVYFMLLYPSEFYMFTLLIFVVNEFVAFYIFDNKIKGVFLSIIATFLTMSINTWLKYDKILSSAEIQTWADIVKERWGYLDMEELRYYDNNSAKSFLVYYSNTAIIPDFILNDIKNDIIAQKEVNKLKDIEKEKERERKMIEEMKLMKERKEVLNKYK